MSSGNVRLRGELRSVLSGSESRAVLFDRSTSSDDHIRSATAAVIERVRRSGDNALIEMAREFDGASLTALETPRFAIDTALNSLSPPLRRALQRAAENIRRAHEGFVPAERVVETEAGVSVGRRPDPYERVGVYAPGGRAVYPSSVLMGVIPARVAGVREVILCSPPGASGLPHPMVLAAAGVAGVDRVFAAGGAGAIAALAIGTQSVPRVQKIVGPGNAFVAEAKLQLSGIVAFDSPAGPSELLVIADESANAATLAREMLAQAEHDPRAAVVAVCSTEALAQRLSDVVGALTPRQERGAIIAESLASRGAILWCNSRRVILDFIAEFAPEHLLLATSDAEELCRQARNAGTVFVGECSSVAFGDYMTGANHVLPTGTLARSYSGLSTLDFVRWTTHQRVTRDAARSLSEDVAMLAREEGLPAHALAAQAWRNI
jgi:histidinol dehydrogenase